MLPVVILCGGLSTRLQSITENIPKSMINILDKPFIDHQLTLLQKNNVKNVILCIGKFGEQIHNYVKDGQKWNMSVQYSDDGKILLGTGGALLKAYSILPNNFIVMNGDSYLDIDYNEILQKYISERNLLLLTVFPIIDPKSYKNVYIKNKNILLYDKSGNNHNLNYIDYGFTLMKRRLLTNYIKESVFDFSLIYSKAISQHSISCYKSPKIFHEIGSYEGLQETKDYINNGGN